MVPWCIFSWTFRTTKGNRLIFQESRKGSVLSLGGLGGGGGGPRFRQVDTGFGYWWRMIMIWKKKLYCQQRACYLNYVKNGLLSLFAPKMHEMQPFEGKLFSGPCCKHLLSWLTWKHFDMLSILTKSILFTTFAGIQLCFVPSRQTNMLHLKCPSHTRPRQLHRWINIMVLCGLFSFIWYIF